MRGVISDKTRARLVGVLEGSSTDRMGIAFNLLLMGLIYASVTLLVLEFRHPETAEQYRTLIDTANLAILALFSFDLLARLLFYDERGRYLLSWDGLVDMLAVLPGLLALILPGMSSVAWLRVLRLVRLLRFIRLLKIGQSSRGTAQIIGGVLQRLLPWMALAAGIKGLILAAEPQPWWPEMGDLSVVITVAGFAISILLGGKLGVVQSRFYEVEDAICRIIGALNDFPKTRVSSPAIKRWLFELHDYIEFMASPKVSQDERDRRSLQMKRQTLDLERVLSEQGIDGPVTGGFHRDTALLIHRIRTRTPHFLERFLRYVTIAYASVAVLALDGFTGFFMVMLIVFLIGGMYILIDDMDNPLPEKGRSMIGIDLRPLREQCQLTHEGSF